MKYLFRSERLGFRNWVDTDIESLQVINSDKEVMEFFPSLYTLEQTTAFIKRMQNSIEEKTYGYFAVDELDSGKFIGFIGILDQDYDAPFMPATDIGWRLNKAFWGKGYTTEGALQCLTYAFQTIQLKSIVSVATKFNYKSTRVMQKIGMQEQQIFEHPLIESSSSLKTCVHYTLTASQFSQR